MVTHAAFPSVAPPQTQHPLTTSKDVRDLLRSANHGDQIRSQLVPLLDRLARGEDMQGSESQAEKRGLELMSLAEVKLEEMDDETLHRTTAGLVYVLSARLDRRFPAFHNRETFDLVMRFCNVAKEEHLELVAHRVSTLAWGLLRLAQSLKLTRHVLQPLQVLLVRSTRRGSLSGTHAAFLEACLIERNFDAPIELLDELFLDVQSARPTYLDVITFFHHAGLISAARKEYARAVRHFVTAVSVPSNATSAIQLVAAKRAILCELITTGKRLHFPKYTSSSVSRSIERYAEDYTALARAFEARDWAKVITHENKEIYINDMNLGLLKTALRSITKRRILRLQKSYTRMMIGDIAQRVGLAGKEEQVKAELINMAQAGDITIQLVDGSTTAAAVVLFVADPCPQDPNKLLKELAQANAMADYVSKALWRGSKELGVAEPWLKRQCEDWRLQAKSGGRGVSGSRSEDIEAMMMGEEFGVTNGPMGRRIAGGKVGADQSDMGF